MKEIVKKCGHCNIQYPATKKFFYGKLTKAGTIISGIPLKKDSHSLRHICKSCHKKYSRLKQQLRRSKELNISLEEYQLTARQISANACKIANLKYIEFEHLDPLQRTYNLKRLKLGYKMEDLPNYQQLWREKHKIKTIANRKYKYEGKDDTYPLKKEVISNMQIMSIVPSRIALRLGIPVKELTPELSDLVTKTVKLKRSMKKVKNSK